MLFDMLSHLTSFLVCVLVLSVATVTNSRLPEPWESRRFREACLRRFKLTDFATNGFQSEALTNVNMSYYIDCLYKLRTSSRIREKIVYPGGIHYPTLIVTNHLEPPVSAVGADWCWLDNQGLDPNGVTKESCCDTSFGPQGLESCWDEHFTFDLCCKGDVSLGELPHFFVGPALDINVANAVRQVGTFDLGQSYALQTLCGKGDVVLDIGANIGGFTVPLAERVGRDGEVHAFEAFRKVFQHLNANVALNGLENVFAHNVALGKEDLPDPVDAYSADLNTFNFPSAMRALHQEDRQSALNNNIKYAKRKEKLIVRQLDSFTFDRIRLIKIDVEFMELEVVLGGLKTIRQHRPVMWVENERYFDDPPDTTFVDTMSKELDYDCKPVARLELLCLSRGSQEGKEGGLPVGFHKVFRHLSGTFRDLSLWKALSEVDPATNS